MADATQIHQIMINLLTNAGHAMKRRGGRLSVLSKNVTVEQPLQGVIHPIAPGRYVKVVVAGYGGRHPGGGKTSNFRTLLHHQGNGEGNREWGCPCFMDHGKLWRRYRYEQFTGRGAEFDFFSHWWTRCRKQGPCPPEARISAGSERILFIDDEQMIVDMVDKILKRLGYRVTPCRSPEKALRLLEVDPPIVE